MKGRCCKAGLAVAALGVGILLALILPSGFLVFLLGLGLLLVGILLCKWR